MADSRFVPRLHGNVRTRGMHSRTSAPRGATCPHAANTCITESSSRCIYTSTAALWSSCCAHRLCIRVSPTSIFLQITAWPVAVAPLRGQGDGTRSAESTFKLNEAFSDTVNMFVQQKSAFAFLLGSAWGTATKHGTGSHVWSHVFCETWKSFSFYRYLTAQYVSHCVSPPIQWNVKSFRYY